MFYRAEPIKDFAYELENKNTLLFLNILLKNKSNEL